MTNFEKHIVVRVTEKAIVQIMHMCKEKKGNRGRTLRFLCEVEWVALGNTIHVLRHPFVLFYPF